MTAVREEARCYQVSGEAVIAVAHIPAEANGRGIVILPGAPQYRVGPHRLFVTIARHLAARGYTVLRADRRGLGDAEGRPQPFEDMQPDTRAAIDALREEDPRVETITVLGLCDGASAALHNAIDDPAVHGLILLNPWVSTEASRAQAALKGYYLPRLARWRRWLAVLGSIAHLRKAVVNIARALLASLQPVSSRDAIPPFAVTMLKNWVDFGGHTLVVLSGRDIDATAFDRLVAQTIGWGPLVEGTGTAVKRLKEADHTFTRLVDREHLLARIDNWLDETSP